MTVAQVVGNKTFTSLDPPDYLAVYLNRTKGSNATTDKIIYTFKGAVAAPLQEPPLERTVSEFSKSLSHSDILLE